MIEATTNLVAIHYTFYCSQQQQETMEQLWAAPVNLTQGYYRLQGIPFFAKSLAVNDILKAEYDAVEQALVLQEVVAFSGHSTVQVVMLDAGACPQATREIFHSMGCHTEMGGDHFFAIDIPVSTHYKPIQEKLLALQQEGLLDFREACLSAQHR